MWKQWKPMVFSTFSLTLHYLGRLSWCPPGTFSISASSSRGTSSGEFSSCTASPHISSHSHPFSWYSHIFSWDMMIFSFWMMEFSHSHFSWYSIRKIHHHSEYAQVPKKSPDPKNANGMRATKNSLHHERLGFRTSLESYFRTMAELSFEWFANVRSSISPYYRSILILRYLKIILDISLDDFHGLSLIFYVLDSIGPLIWPFCLPLAPVMKPWRPCTSQKVRKEIPSLHFTLDLNLTSP